MKFWKMSSNYIYVYNVYIYIYMYIICILYVWNTKAVLPIG